MIDRRGRRAARAVGLALACMWVAAASTVAADPARSPPQRIDDFESAAPWSAVPADGVEMRLSEEGGALRIDFDFHGGGGYAVAHRAVSVDLPERYAFRFRVRGECLPNDLEFKLIDSTGANVWWCNRRGYAFEKQWTTLVTKQRQIQFAWGPQGGGELRHVAAIEFAVTAGRGGKGTVWLDDLSVAELPAPEAIAPVARATSSRPGHGPERALDADSTSSWWSAAADRAPALTVDFGADRELGGLVVDWVPGRRPDRYRVETSADGRAWGLLREVVGSRARDYLDLPETDTRYLRLRAPGLASGRSCAIARLAVKPLEWGASLESFFQAVAADAPRGDYPRGIAGEQSYWTVVGRDLDQEEGLVSEDGAVETGKRSFSVEPFLYADGRLRTWADAHITRWLEDSGGSAPAVRWELDSLRLTLRADAVGGGPDTASLRCRYQVENLGSRPRVATLFLAIRPFQVNPPSQFLNTRGGVSPIREMAREGNRIRVNGDRGVVSLSPISGFGAATFDQGDIVEALRRGAPPRRDWVVDPFQAASGALAYRLELPPAGSRSVTVLTSLGPGPIDTTGRDPGRPSLRSLSSTALLLPPAAAEAVGTLYAQLGFILVNRDGPAIQPGSRSYERSWIRDGSLTSSALLRMGLFREVRDYLEWYARYPYPNGKVPCCVDSRGADPVPEHDSSGEFIFLVAEYLRQTGDRDFAGRLWPQVRAAAAYLDSLRQQRRTAEYRTPEKREFFGLLPPSISHEGYSAKPMHSYWDDLFALRGFRDAAFLARSLGIRAEAARFDRIASEFGRDLDASILATMAKHRIDYLPGCADLGDFDATSTTIALSPVQAGRAVPEAALRRTFERYWDFFEKRRDGRSPWEAFTPYEMRNIGAFVRLGWRDRANQLLDWFLDYRRPEGWPQWPEVVWHDARTPHFLGDLPHTWVGSDYVRSVLDMLAYESDADSTLVLGAGVRESWLTVPGVIVRGLHTSYGRLDFAMLDLGTTRMVRVEQVRVPRGGIVVAPPGIGPGWTATVNGKPAPISASGRVWVHVVPATLQFHPPPPRPR